MSNADKKKEIKKYRKHAEKIMKKIGYMLPKKWVETIDITDINCQQPSFLDLRGKKYHRIVAFWNTYHKLPRPVVLEKNNVLLDGYNIIIFARDFKISTIPCIRLENVEVVYQRN